MWNVTIGLASGDPITIKNLVAINQINSPDEPIEVFIPKDFYTFQLPNKADKLAFIRSPYSVLTLPVAEINRLLFEQKL